MDGGLALAVLWCRGEDGMRERHGQSRADEKVSRKSSRMSRVISERQAAAEARPE